MALLDEAVVEALPLAEPHQQGRLLFYAGDRESSIPLAAQIAEEEDSPLAWLALGELYLYSDAPADAESALTEAIQRDDGLIQAYALRAEARLILGDSAGAELDARTANFLKPLTPVESFVTRILSADRGSPGSNVMFPMQLLFDVVPVPIFRT